MHWESVHPNELFIFSTLADLRDLIEEFSTKKNDEQKKDENENSKENSLQTEEVQDVEDEEEYGGEEESEGKEYQWRRVFQL